MTNDDVMEAGEKELRQAFEEVTTRNVQTAIAYTKTSRAMVRKLEKDVDKQNELIRLYDVKFEEIRKQLAALQAKMYAGGS